VFVHIVSSLFLGNLLVLPFVLNIILSRKGNELKTALRTTLSFTRASHYALIFLMISGGWIIVTYSSYPSIIWLVLAIILLILFGSLIGMIHKNIKSIIIAENSEKKLLEAAKKLKEYSRIALLTIISAIFIMTNRSLFS